MWDRLRNLPGALWFLAQKFGAWLADLWKGKR